MESVPQDDNRIHIVDKLQAGTTRTSARPSVERLETIRQCDRPEIWDDGAARRLPRVAGSRARHLPLGGAPLDNCGVCPAVASIDLERVRLGQSQPSQNARSLSLRDPRQRNGS